MQEIISTGKTVQDAVLSACEQLGLSSADIVYEILEDAHSGFLGLGSKPAKIKAWKREDEISGKSLLEELERPKAPEVKPQPQQNYQPNQHKNHQQPQKPQQPKPQPKPQAESTQPEIVLPEEHEEPVSLDALPGSAKEAFEYFRGIAQRMGAEKLEYSAVKTEKGIKLIADGADASLLIGRRGDTMDSIQYLCTLIGSRSDDDYCKVSLDVAGYRKKREKTLISLAQREAAKVKKSKYSVTLEPMNPYERRIVHSAVQNIEGVKSESTGTEPNRRVVISLESGGKQGYDRRGGRGGRGGNGHGGHSGGYRKNNYDRAARDNGSEKKTTPDRPAERKPEAPKSDTASKAVYGKIEL